MRLLLVEDDNTIREFLSRAVNEAGYRVDACAHANDAEQLALEGVHDAMVIDLGLPDMDGLELIQRMRAQGVTAPTACRKSSSHLPWRASLTNSSNGSSCIFVRARARAR